MFIYVKTNEKQLLLLQINFYKKVIIPFIKHKNFGFVVKKQLFRQYKVHILQCKVIYFVVY